jgi:hypothetical protein
MVTVQLNGGLGNQLFQYAAGKALSLHHNVPLQIDVSWFHKGELHYLEVPRDFELYNFLGVTDPIIHTNPAPQAESRTYLERKITSKIFPAYKKAVYIEPFCHYDSNFFKSKKSVVLKGQWQSEKYFSNNESFFKNAFRLKKDLIENSIAKAKHLASKESVAVHVRRADYLRLKIILEWHGIMTEDYYRKAFKILDERLSVYEVYYFTDDPAWVQNNLLSIKEGEILSGSVNQTHYDDFHLMSHCRHNIIANSSFSWWAAWLNNNSDKIVIGPKKWFDQGPKDTQDILPESWIKI